MEELVSVYTVVENVLVVLVIHGMLGVTEIGLVVEFEAFLIRGSLPISCCSIDDELVPNIEVVIVLVYTLIALLIDAMVSIFKVKEVVRKEDKYKKLYLEIDIDVCC